MSTETLKSEPGAQRRFYQSPVDYDAWRAGYTPPSDHNLIDQLMFRGAHVVSMSDYGERGAWWLVIRGKRPSAMACRAIFETMIGMDEEEPAPAAEPDPYVWIDPFAAHPGTTEAGNE